MMDRMGQSLRQPGQSLGNALDPLCPARPWHRLISSQNIVRYIVQVIDSAPTADRGDGGGLIRLSPSWFKSRASSSAESCSLGPECAVAVLHSYCLSLWGPVLRQPCLIRAGIRQCSGVPAERRQP